MKIALIISLALCGLAPAATTVISDLTTLTGSSVDSAADFIPISDMSVPETKKITPSQLAIGMGLVIGTTVQAYDADLAYLAGFTPSANVKSILNAADNASIKSMLSLDLVENTALSTWTGSTNITTLGNLSLFTIDGGATPAGISSFGRLSSDNNLWAANHGALVFHNGTNITALLGTDASDVPTNGQVPTWNTAGNITWETPASGSSVGDGDKGDVTVTGTGATWTIDSATISLAKMANLAQSKLIGRATASTGVPEAITVGSDFSLAGTTLSLAVTPQPLDASLTALTGITLGQNKFYARLASGSGVADTAVTIGADFSLAANTLALANSYQTADAYLTAISANPTTLSATTALVANTFYKGAISTRTVTLSTASSFTHAHIHYAGTAAASTVITWPAGVVRQVGSSGYASSTTFAIGNAEFDLYSDGTDWYLADSTGGGGGSGTVTSVGWTGGLVSVATATTTPAFTVAGTSGGIPYFSSSSTWASSAALAANAIVIGGGAGTTPATTTTGTGVVTALGVNTGSAGAFVVNGGALGTPSSGTGTNITGIPEGGLSLTNITTNNSSTTKHGFLKQLSNSASEYMDGSGNWSTPVGGGTGEHSVTFSVTGGGAALATGVQDIICNTGFSGTLTRWACTVSPADTITFDILRSADTGVAPVTSIVGGSGTKPNVASGVNSHSTTFTSWTSTTITAYDNFKCQITAVGGTATAATVTLYFQ